MISPGERSCNVSLISVNHSHFNISDHETESETPQRYSMMGEILNHRICFV